jgi:hypothetical protein
MKGFDSEFPHNMENFRRAKFNKPFNNQTIMKRFCFIRIAFSLFSFMELETMWSLFQVMKLYL